MDSYESNSNIAEERLVRVGITGAGTSVPTRRAGPGVTVTRTGVGVIRFSFDQNQATFVGVAGYMFRADTPSAVKGYTATAGAYVAPSGSTKGYVEVSFWSSTFAAVDLAAAQYLDITFGFAAQSVIK